MIEPTLDTSTAKGFRVLLFSSTYSPSTGGVEAVTRRLASELLGEGHAVLVMTNRYPRSLPKAERIEGVAVERHAYPNIVPSPGRRRMTTVLKQLLSIPLAAIELARLVRRVRTFKPAVVNVHYLSYPGLYAICAAWAAKVPVVLSFHGSDVPGVPYSATYGWVGRWACRHANVIVANSEDIRGYLERMTPREEHGKIVVARPGIDAEPLVADGESSSIDAYVLVVARLVEKKGVDVALRAMSMLKREGVKTRLVIAGDGPMHSQLAGLTRDPDIQDQVDMRGSVRPDEVKRLMRGCAFLVVPSYWEAYGMVALEAMVEGKAVVACNNGGIAEIVVDEETGLLSPPKDVAALARNMARLTREPALASELGMRGRERALTEFTWLQTVEAYEAAFQKAIGSSRRAAA